MAGWGRINGYPFVGFSSPIAPYEKLPSIWFGRAKLEAKITLSFGHLHRFQFAGMNITTPYKKIPRLCINLPNSPFLESEIEDGKTPAKQIPASSPQPCLH